MSYDRLDGVGSQWGHSIASSTIGTQTDIVSHPQATLLSQLPSSDAIFSQNSSAAQHLPDGYHFIKLLSSEHQCMSDVVLAECGSTGKKVVLKRARYPEAHRLIEQELRLLRTVCYHESTPPNIVHLHSPYLLDEVWLATEFVETGSLERLCEEPHQLLLHEILNIALQSCEALAHLHSLNIIHRDVKPANILYNRETGTVQLADFGLSKQCDNAKQLHGEVTNFAGTKDYAAPEVFHDRVCAGSDMWAWACTMAHLITAVRPYHGDNFMVPYSHELRESVVEVIPAMQEVLNRCFTNPNERPSASELSAKIRQILLFCGKNEDRCNERVSSAQSHPTVEEFSLANHADRAAAEANDAAMLRQKQLEADLVEAVRGGNIDMLQNIEDTICNADRNSIVGQLMHVAAEASQIGTVRLLLNEHNGNPNSKNSFGDTVLHTVVKGYFAKVRQGNRRLDANFALLPLCDLLLRHEADLTVANNLHQTPLHYIVTEWSLHFRESDDDFMMYQQGLFDLLRLFLKTVRTSSTNTLTASHLCVVTEDAIKARCPTIAIRQLLEVVPKIENKFLLCACRAGVPETVRLILEKGVSARREIDGVFPLLEAANSGHSRIAALLVDRGANISDDVMTIACAKGWALFVRLSIEDKKLLRRSQVKRLREAINNKQSNVARILIEHGTVVSRETLCLACEQGLTDTVGLIVGKGLAVFGDDDDYDSPLYTAVSHSRIEIARILVDHGAEVHTIVLWEACRNGLANLVRFFLKKRSQKAFLDANYDLLLTAVHNHHSDVARVLLDHGVRLSDKVVNVACKEGLTELIRFILSTPCHYRVINEIDNHLTVAVRFGNLEIARALVHRGASISCEAFTLCCALGYTEFVEFLLQHGASVDGNKEYSPLLRAIQNERTTIVANLIINYKATLRPEALMIASFNASYALVKLLLESGADPNARHTSQVSLEACVGSYVSESRKVAVSRLLIEFGGTVSRAALQLAAERANVELMRLLLRHASKPINLQPLFQLAVARNSGSLMSLLLQHGERTVSKQWDKSDLFEAVKKRHFHLAGVLVEEGRYSKQFLSRALRLCCEDGTAILAQQLLRRGASLNFVNKSRGKRKRVPLQVALQSNQFDVALVLIHAGADCTMIGKDDLQQACRPGGAPGVVAQLLLRDVTKRISSVAQQELLSRAVKKAQWDIVELLLGDFEDPIHCRQYRDIVVTDKVEKGPYFSLLHFMAASFAQSTLPPGATVFDLMLESAAASCCELQL